MQQQRGFSLLFFPSFISCANVFHKKGKNILTRFPPLLILLLSPPCARGHFRTKDGSYYMIGALWMLLKMHKEKHATYFLACKVRTYIFSARNPLHRNRMFEDAKKKPLVLRFSLDICTLRIYGAIWKRVRAWRYLLP